MLVICSRNLSPTELGMGCFAGVQASEREDTVAPSTRGTVLPDYAVVDGQAYRQMTLKFRIEP